MMNPPKKISRFHLEAEQGIYQHSDVKLHSFAMCESIGKLKGIMHLLLSVSCVLTAMLGLYVYYII